MLFNLSPAHRAPEQQEGRQSTGPASPDSPTCEGGIPHSCYQTLHLPLHPGRCTGITAHTQTWGNRSPASPGSLLLPPPGSMQPLPDQCQEAEARVTFSPVRPHCYLKPSPASTSITPSALLQEEELSKVLFALAGTQAGQQQTLPVQCYQAPHLRDRLHWQQSS